MNKKIRSYLTLLCILLVLTAAAIGMDTYVWRHVQAEKVVAFQRMVGGVGMGAISTPLFNFINYDPRIQPVDDSVTWPVPGVYSYGPDRTASIFYFEEIPMDQLRVKGRD
ncbi:MAG TPA: hypothetical protein VMW90_07515 [Acidobacteriota bacterium]|nr:hypothetical protein [Acidobacteriota bacterium]